MRPARRASSPRHPDPPANPRSTLPYPTCGRLQKPPTGYQSLTRPATGISRPPIASYLPPHLGSKMTKARTANLEPLRLDAGQDNAIAGAWVKRAAILESLYDKSKPD